MKYTLDELNKLIEEEHYNYYKKCLEMNILFEIYPELSGNWEDDKETFISAENEMKKEMYKYKF